MALDHAPGLEVIRLQPRHPGGEDPGERGDAFSDRLPRPMSDSLSQISRRGAAPTS